MKRLGLLMCALSIGFASPDVANAGSRRDSGPPPWAAAHGYRYTPEQRQRGPIYHSKRQHQRYHHFRHRDKRHNVRWRIPAHRWTFRQQESALIAALVGASISNLLTSAPPAAQAPRSAAIGQQPYPTAGFMPPYASVGSGQRVLSAPYCREFSRDALIGGRPQEIVGVACQQPDGSWEVVSVDRR